MSAALLLLAVLAAAPAPAARYLAFGVPGDWVVLEAHSRKSERVRLPAQFSARTLTVSTDGQHIVFTAHDEAARNDLMYRWDWRTGAAPVRIGGPQGFHSDPAISPDHQWVYFAHHPRMGGPPGLHEPRANAQLYKVRLDGSGLTALSNENGCHLSPAFRSDAELVYVHTPCRAPKKSLYLMTGGVVRPETLATEDLNEPSFSPDGARLVFVARDGAHAVLKEWTSSKRPVRVLHRYILSEGTRARAQYGVSARELFFQDGQAVMRLSGSSVTRLFAFGDVP